MGNRIDYPWIGEMFIYIIHEAVHYPWIAKMLNSIMHGYCKMNLHHLWIVEYIMCEHIIIHRQQIPVSMKHFSDSTN